MLNLFLYINKIYNINKNILELLSSLIICAKEDS